MSEQPSAVEREPRPTEPLITSPGHPRRPVRHPRLRTVLLGLVGLGTAVSALIGQLTDRELDGQLVALVALIGSGTVLLIGGISAAVRESRDGRDTTGP